MITFRTPGTLDIRAVVTMGVSVKENDSPIGFFGTGLKYAIAILLRHCQSITIHTGGQTYRFAAKPTSIRGSVFEIVTMNGQELGFTTQLGKSWELWMAYRELICNTWDENGTVFVGSAPVAISPQTDIIVEGREFQQIHDSRHTFLLLSQPDLTTDFGNVIFRLSSSIFYRGIAVVKLKTPSFFTYNITVPLTLTEERTAKNGWEVSYIINNIIAALPGDKLEAVITCGNGYHEGRMDFSSSYLVANHEALMNACGKAARFASAKLNPILARQYEEHEKKELAKNIEDFQLSPIQQTSLERAQMLVESLGFDISAYPIRFVRRLGDHTYGMAKDGTIYISQLCFDAGAKQVAGTLIEEFIHLREGYADNTREFQNYLLNRLVGIGEELKGVSL